MAKSNSEVGSQPVDKTARLATGNTGRQARKPNSSETKERKSSSMGKNMYYYTDKKSRTWYSEPLRIENSKGQQVSAQAVRKSVNRAGRKRADIQSKLVKATR